MHELQILLLLDPRLACRCVAQAGTFRPSPPAWTRSLNGVAVTSQILCISITLNKGLRTFQLLFHCCTVYTIRFTECCQDQFPEVSFFFLACLHFTVLFQHQLFCQSDHHRFASPDILQRNKFCLLYTSRCV